MKRRIKIIIDIIMFLLFLYLLSYRPGMGLMYHAVIGIAQLSLFILHHLLNLKWYRTLFKGRYNFRRILLTASDFLLLIAMGFMIASSVMISGMVFDFGIRMTGWWRRIHVASSGWCFLLTGFHVGMHLQGMFGKLEKKMRRVSWLYRLIQAILAAAGIYCFLQSDLWPRAGTQASAADLHQRRDVRNLYGHHNRDVRSGQLDLFAGYAPQKTRVTSGKDGI